MSKWNMTSKGLQDKMCEAESLPQVTGQSRADADVVNRI